jgi:tight adherence protein C
MVRAGYDGESPIFLFAVIRVALLIGLPLFTVVIGAGDTPLEKLFFLFGALVLSWIVPRGSLDSLVRQRQERIKRALPDALDLLIVCVEAGSSLESAILRVSRDLAGIHPDLAFELGNVVRRTRAGVPRAEALRGLWDRTGVPELRTLAANIAQSERWGTSVGRVLRVTGETLRRKRRHTVERRAAQATLKMTIPLVTMILPPLFIVVLGPGVLQLIGAVHLAK